MAPYSYKLAPSVLSADFGNLRGAMDICRKGGAHWIHIDVMDNQFVPNLTIGPPVVKSLRKYTDKFLDVHMMVVNPEKLVEPFARAGADGITFHVEATENPNKVIDLIRSTGKQVGISLKPGTSLTTIEPYLEKVDLVLIMSVEPGFGGQGYLSDSSERIKQLKSRLNEMCLDRVIIEVDGGVSPTNSKRLAEAGADILVAGSAIFKARDPIQIVKEMKGS